MSYRNTCSVYRSDWNCMMHDSWKTFALPHDHVCNHFIRWPENVRRVSKILWSFLKHCYILLNFVLFFSSSWHSVTMSNTLVTTEHEHKSSYSFFVGLYACMLDFVGQHYTSWIFYTSINNNGFFHGIYVLCKHTISLINFTSFSVGKWNIMGCYLNWWSMASVRLALMFRTLMRFLTSVFCSFHKCLIGDNSLR